MDSKKAALKGILEFAAQLKRDKSVKGVKKEPKVEVEIESGGEEPAEQSPLDQLLASLKG